MGLGSSACFVPRGTATQHRSLGMGASSLQLLKELVVCHAASSGGCVCSLCLSVKVPLVDAGDVTRLLTH